MIKNWKIFLESKSDISYETLSEVIMFRNFSKMTGNEEIHRKIENFINTDMDEDINDLVPISTEDHRQFRKKIEELVNVIKSNPDFSNTLLQLYSEVEDKMGGFPKFYELEDIFIDFIDGGWGIDFVLDVGKYMEIEVSNEIVDLNITYDDYINLISESNSILRRIKSHFNLDCSILKSSYIKEEYKNEVIIKFGIR